MHIRTYTSYTELSSELELDDQKIQDKNLSYAFNKWKYKTASIGFAYENICIILDLNLHETHCLNV